MNIEGKDLVACTAIVTSGVLVYMGHNGAFMNLIAIVIGWYFGAKHNGSKATDNNKPD